MIHLVCLRRKTIRKAKKNPKNKNQQIDNDISEGLTSIRLELEQSFPFVIMELNILGLESYLEQIWIFL